LCVCVCACVCARVCVRVCVFVCTGYGKCSYAHCRIITDRYYQQKIIALTSLTDRVRG